MILSWKFMACTAFLPKTNETSLFQGLIWCIPYPHSGYGQLWVLHKIAHLFMPDHFARHLKGSLDVPIFSLRLNGSQARPTVKSCGKLAESGVFLCSILKTGVENHCFANSFALCFGNADLLHMNSLQTLSLLALTPDFSWAFYLLKPSLY